MDDLEEWTDHGPTFASTDEYVQEGISDGVPWSDGLLWAPDVAKKGDWYYLYFCLSDGSEGVARSRKPGGPFTDAKRITMGGKPIEGIDPSSWNNHGSIVKIKDQWYVFYHGSSIIQSIQGDAGWRELRLMKNRG